MIPYYMYTDNTRVDSQPTSCVACEHSVSFHSPNGCSKCNCLLTQSPKDQHVSDVRYFNVVGERAGRRSPLVSDEAEIRMTQKAAAMRPDLRSAGFGKYLKPTVR